MSTHFDIRNRISARAGTFSESVIREMSRMAAQYGAVNLAQGLPDFPCHQELKQAASDALFADVNQYAITWGDKLLREAIAEKSHSYLGMKVDPETDITVTCGATESMIAAMIATVDTGQEVIVFEPFYENYGPDAILSGASPRHVTLHPPDWTFDEKELEQAFNKNTKAIIINTPHNPTGKVFTRQELETIGRLCQKWGALAVTDEIYEHILYDGAKHVAIGSLPGMEDLTITINSLSKTYSVTGWRVGWSIAHKEITKAIRKVHDFLTIGAPAPLQRAGVTAIKLPQSYYDGLTADYRLKREKMMGILDEVGIKYFRPQGAYYLFADIGNFGYKTDIEFTQFITQEIGVAVVPSSSFFSRPELGHRYVRFCFSRKDETLAEAHKRLLKLKHPS